MKSNHIKLYLEINLNWLWNRKIYPIINCLSISCSIFCKIACFLIFLKKGSMWKQLFHSPCITMQVTDGHTKTWFYQFLQIIFDFCGFCRCHDKPHVLFLINLNRCSAIYVVLLLAFITNRNHNLYQD